MDAVLWVNVYAVQMLSHNSMAFLAGTRRPSQGIVRLLKASGVAPAMFFEPRLLQGWGASTLQRREYYNETAPVGTWI